MGPEDKKIDLEVEAYMDTIGFDISKVCNKLGFAYTEDYCECEDIEACYDEDTEEGDYDLY